MHPDPKTYRFSHQKHLSFPGFSHVFQGTQHWQVRGVRQEFHVQGRSALSRLLGHAQELRQERSVQGPRRDSLFFFCQKHGKKNMEKCGFVWLCMVFLWFRIMTYYDMIYYDIGIYVMIIWWEYDDNHIDDNRPLLGPCCDVEINSNQKWRLKLKTS